MVWVDKVRVHYHFLQCVEIPFWIVYSECGRFQNSFYDLKDAIEYAMEEYESRLEQEERREWLDKW